MSPLGSDGKKVAEDGESGTPVVTESGSVVGPTQMSMELLVSVSKGEKTVVVIEEMLVRAVRTLDFAVVSWGSNADQFVAYPVVL